MTKSISLIIISFLTVACMLIFVSCRPSKDGIFGSLRTSLETEPSEFSCPEITVWIHGTRLTPKAVAPYFFHALEGLHPALTYAKKYHARKIAENLASGDPERFNLHNIYFFGWSGKLSFKARKQAAHELHTALIDLRQAYYALYRAYPYIRIITHSHGGNVALNLASLPQKESLAIDELILLACPVQSETVDYVSDDCFKKVFSFYSESDLIQVIDPQGLYRNKHPKTSLFSKRRFPNNTKLVQIKTCGKNRGLSHIEFLLDTFTQQLPTVLSNLKTATQTPAETELHVYKKKIVHEKMINDFSLHL